VNAYNSQILLVLMVQNLILYDFTMRIIFENYLLL